MKEKMMRHIKICLDKKRRELKIKEELLSEGKGNPFVSDIMRLKDEIKIGEDKLRELKG